MKKSFLSLALMLMCVANAHAWKAETMVEGHSYALMNAASGLFLNTSNGLDSQPSTLWQIGAVTDDPFYQLSSGDKYLRAWSEWGWNYEVHLASDQSSASNFKLTSVAADSVFTICSASTVKEGGSFGGLGAKDVYVYVLANGSELSFATSETTESNAQWKLVSKEQVRLFAVVDLAEKMLQDADTSIPDAAFLADMVSQVREGAELPNTAALFDEAANMFELAIDAFKRSQPIAPGEDVTLRFIRNASFEEGPYLVNEVTGWEVTKFTAGGEAFSSPTIADRIFSGVEGEYLYNTWGGTPDGEYLLRQNLGVLPRGVYRMDAVVASSDSQDKLFVCCGASQRAVAFGTDKTVGVPVTLCFEADGENEVAIDLHSGSWFKADAFHLVYLAEEMAPLTELTFIIDNAEMKDNGQWLGSGREIAGVTAGAPASKHWSGDANCPYFLQNHEEGPAREQVVSFPSEGYYLLMTAVRCAAEGSYVEVKAGDAVARTEYDETIGATGGTIDIEGGEWESVEAGRAAGATFANDNEGYGWTYNKLFVKVDVAGQPIRISLNISDWNGSGHEAAAGGMHLLYWGMDDPNGINEVQSNNQTINADAARVYDLSGRQMRQPQRGRARGIYIVGGKKVVY